MWWWIWVIGGAFAAYAAWEESQTLHWLGRVVWPGNDLLPEHANYRVSLVDLTAQGAPQVVASTFRSLKEGGEGMPFKLSCHRKRLRPDRHYGFWAELVAGDQVLYTSGLAQITDLSRDKALVLQVQQVTTPGIVSPPSLHNVLPEKLGGTAWRVRTVAGTPAPAEAGPVVEIRPNGQLLGQVAGYSFFAEAAFHDNTLRIMGLNVGGLATQLDLQEQQQRLIQSLFATTRFDLQDRTLSFFNAEGQATLTLEPLHSADGETLH